MLGRFVKQPNEIHDYVLDYADYFAKRSDAYVSHVVTATTGITVQSSSWDTSTKMLRIVLAGGASGTSYKITVRLTTSLGIVEEDEFLVAVKEL